MTAVLHGYYLNTEKVRETKGVCFDNSTFSAGPELSSLFPWVLGVEEGRGQGQSRRRPAAHVPGEGTCAQALAFPGWPLQLHGPRNGASLGLTVWIDFALFAVTRDGETSDLGSS